MKIEIINEQNHIGWTDLRPGDVYQFGRCHYLVVVESPGRLMSVNLETFKVGQRDYSTVQPILKSSTLKIRDISVERDVIKDEEDEWETIKDVDSSFIEEIGYNKTDMELSVVIQDQEYIYGDVPLNSWLEFKKTWSKGEYYNSYIKGLYKVT